MSVHAHRVCHIVFKIGGPDVAFGIKDREHTLSEDNVLLVNAWEPHFYTHNPEAPPTVLLALYIEPQWLRIADQRFLYSTHPHFFAQPSVSARTRLADLKHDLLEILLARETTDVKKLEATIVQTIVELSSRVTHWSTISASQLTGGIAYDKRIRRAIEEMKIGCGVALDFDQIARSVNLSRPHFFHLFARQTGITPATFGSMLRMEASIDRLTASSIPLQDIAQGLGFDASGNFTRFFVSQQGVTPSQYRRNVELVATDLC
jgi:AraC-like DNA-binding protein